jgi:preprotein translocase subunit SecF
MAKVGYKRWVNIALHNGGARRGRHQNGIGNEKDTALKLHDSTRSKERVQLNQRKDLVSRLGLEEKKERKIDTVDEKVGLEGKRRELKVLLLFVIIAMPLLP